MNKIIPFFTAGKEAKIQENISIIAPKSLYNYVLTIYLVYMSLKPSSDLVYFSINDMFHSS